MKHTFPNQFEFQSDELLAGLPKSPNAKGYLYNRTFKRAVDLVLCVLAVPVVSLVVLILAVVVSRDGGSPFFGHVRVGRDGKPFKCWKIRSMVVDADERLKELLGKDPKAAAQWKAERKLDNDPRITQLGRVLRKTSLDELPQLWNIIKGEMSFVGPRPVPREELNENYGEFKAVYKRMRPGLTGQWQVSGRNDVTYAERVQMDIDYYKEMSASLDLKIVAKTALAVLNRTGK